MSQSGRFPDVQDLGPRIANRYKEAFGEGFNLVGLGAACAASLAMLNPLPLLAALVAEAAYLVFVPDSRWYMSRLEHRYDAEVLARREALKQKILPRVQVEIRDRYVRLEAMRRQIETQTEKETPWFRQAMRKLDYMLEKYLQFASKQVEFAGYLMALRDEAEDESQNQKAKRKPKFDVAQGPKVLMSPEWIDQNVDAIRAYYADEIAEIDTKLKSDADFPTKSVVSKRRDILERRQKYVDRIGLILHNLASQMQLMGDTFGLINDEIRARSPEQVLSDIDEVITASNSLADAIDEITPIDELVARVGAA